MLELFGDGLALEDLVLAVGEVRFEGKFTDGKGEDERFPSGRDVSIRGKTRARLQCVLVSGLGVESGGAIWRRTEWKESRGRRRGDGGDP